MSIVTSPNNALLSPLTVRSVDVISPVPETLPTTLSTYVFTACSVGKSVSELSAKVPSVDLFAVFSLVAIAVEFAVIAISLSEMPEALVVMAVALAFSAVVALVVSSAIAVALSEISEAFAVIAFVLAVISADSYRSARLTVTSVSPSEIVNKLEAFKIASVISSS
jgi:hypothetical protein